MDLQAWAQLLPTTSADTSVRSNAAETVESLASAQYKTSSADFQAALTQATAVLSEHQQSAQEAVNTFVQGAHGDLHNTMLQLEKSDISLRYAVSIRERVLEAYREVMRMGA